MRLANTLLFWGAISATGYFLGSQWFWHVVPTKAVTLIFGVATLLFTATAFPLATVIKLYDTQPPSNLDDQRQDYWKKLFDRRWRRVWIRWSLILCGLVGACVSTGCLATGVGSLSVFAGIGCAALVLGITALILCVSEVFSVRNTIRLIEQELSENARIHAFLNGSEK